ncbi:hypothetical protein [Geobacter anodireducens]
MEMLYTMMVVLTTIVSAVMIPRIMLDWLRYQEFLRDRNDEALRALIAGQKGWMMRHGLCALGAVALVVCIKCLPGLARYDELAGVTAIYGMMTLAFASWNLFWPNGSRAASNPVSSLWSPTASSNSSTA